MFMQGSTVKCHIQSFYMTIYGKDPRFKTVSENPFVRRI